MGRNHARVYSELSTLVGVFDPDRKTSEDVAKKYNVRSYSDLDELIGKSDVKAVTIAGPTTTHFEAVIDCLNAGMDVLVEKPIADTEAKAREMIETAKKNGRILSVGMIERHNPVVRFTREMILKGIVGDLITLTSKRLSSIPPRIKDVGVITDIGVHDIDAIRYLSGSDPISVYAVGGKVANTKFIDYATMIIVLENGMKGIAEVSWLSPMKVRKIILSGSSSIAEMDYIDQELQISTSSFGEFSIDNLWRIPQKYDTRKIRIMAEEPLKREIIDFLSAVRNRTNPLVGGEDGLMALKIAKSAEMSIESGQVVRIGKNREG